MSDPLNREAVLRASANLRVNLQHERAYSGLPLNPARIGFSYRGPYVLLNPFRVFVTVNEPSRFAEILR